MVYFNAIRIAPADSGAAALQRWLDFFKAANPSMVSRAALHAEKREKETLHVREMQSRRPIVGLPDGLQFPL